MTQPVPAPLPFSKPTRRGFLSTAAALAATPLVAAEPATTPGRRNIPLGFDNFAVRALKWNARQLIDYAEKLQCDSLFITDFSPFEGRLDDASLAEVRRYGQDRGIAIALGSWSICPSAKQFKHDWGCAEEHLATGIRMAKALGSPAFRVILGNHEDRLSAGGIAARIADTVEVLKSQRHRAIDSGVKIAVENHAGDMQSRELVQLVKAAGPEYVGVNFDSGNACWTLEDPVAALATLAPDVVTTSLRDTMVWESARGVTTQWTAMGDGCTDLPAFFDLFERLCPGVTVHIETISGFAREFPILESDFWQSYPAARAADLAAFLALARKGRLIQPFQPPPGAARPQAEQNYQRAELERSIRHCRNVLGLGMRG